MRSRVCLLGFGSQPLHFENAEFLHGGLVSLFSLEDEDRSVSR